MSVPTPSNSIPHSMSDPRGATALQACAPPAKSEAELLAPAGNMECAHAAVENGANAIYFGLANGFNARARAANFALRELDELLDFIHRRGVRGFVTLNTLVFPAELEQLEANVRAIALAGVDAVLVQDLGAARLIRAVAPDLEIHASTQMTMTSAENIAEVERLGIARVVLARETSIDEITKIRSATAMPLETFVHGALCVSYSGQCLTSESLGGRSANRGQCAQACRLPYELVCDDKDVPLGTQKYLLSPQDLAAYDKLDDLLRAGVTSFKIEGRLKTPEYVANITKNYRDALDAALAGVKREMPTEAVREMELSFSRGFSPGWLDGCDHKMLVPGISSAKRGVLLGHVVGIRRGRVAVRLDASIRRGDGVVFDGDRASGAEQGGRIYEVIVQGEGVLRAVVDELSENDRVVELGFERNSLALEAIEPGQKIWKTDDPELTQRLRRTFAGPDPRRRVAVDVEVDARVDKPLVVRARCETGSACEVQSPDALVEAIKHPLDEATLQKQLSRLGGTIYELREMKAKIEGRPMIPLSVLGQIRHAIIESLDQAAADRPTPRVANDSPLPALRAEGAPHRIVIEQDGAPAKIAQHVLCRTLAQLEAIARAAVSVDAPFALGNLIADFNDIRQYRQAVTIAKTHGATLLLATPRIQKATEYGIFNSLAKHGAEGALVRNLAGLRYFVDRGLIAVADYSLNAANDLTVDFLRSLGAARVTASYDLNREQLLELVEASSPAGALEVVVHQHMPMFHMEHCVFCSVLSPGTNFSNCGRPCDDHKVELRDRLGMLHPLQADVGCRNTLYNATAQSGAEVAGDLAARGVRNFRIELLEESPEQAIETVRLYSQLLAGKLSGREVWRALRATNSVGVTRGTLEERRNPLAIL